MFTHAYKIATGFTRPLVVSRRHFDRSCDSTCGTFVVINEDGWIVTASHLLSSYDRARRDAEEIAAYYGAIAAIEGDGGIPRPEKFERIRALPDNPKWITDISSWWGWDGVQVSDLRFLPEGDLAVGRLRPFSRNMCPAYPVLKAPDDVEAGMALCKLGYPFQKVRAAYREATGSFELSPDARALYCFPMEGLSTRTLNAGKSGDGRYDIKFLETSSPGLRGQSGGPMLDANGTVWGILSRTDNYIYGSFGRLDADGREVEESQSINLAVGIHPELIVRFLTDNGIRFALSDY